VWEKVLVSTEFAASTHGEIGCIACHGGQEGVLEKEDAHEGMVIDPSEGNAAVCAECHEETVETFPSSLHATQQGYFTAYARRGGMQEEQYFEMFEARCAECHASCGQCHVSRPASVGGGLTHGHTFRREPSQTNQCTACHGSRVGDEFRGKNEGIPADVHYLGGLNCMDCHTGMELHGDGTTPDDRFANQAGPACLECHPDVLADDTDVTEHWLHGDQVACQVCHSVTYKNCYSCHVQLDSQGLRYPSELDFRIGRNPEVTAERPYEYVLLRHIPIAPDTFEPWGLEMAEYTATPTWRMATPHNIQRNTPQTEDCGNCHDSLDLFLTADYLAELVDRGLMVPEELEANEPVLITEIPGGLPR
jgi:hypothetical protein